MKKVIIFLTIGSLVGCYSKAPEKSALEGQILPAFSLQLSDSIRYVKTSSSPDGKPVALFYFGPHCPYSREQAEEIAEDMDRLKDIQFYFVTNASLSDMQHFIKQYHLNQYRNIIIGRDTSTTIANYYEIRGVPYMALYTKDKKLHQTFYGKVYSSEILEGTKK